MTTAVLIPGNMCDARLWTPAVRAVLDARAIAVIDADCTRDDRIDAMAARALAMVAGPLLPIGFSMGGIVALDMARQAPARIAAMILSDTNAGADLPDRAAARPAQQARVRAGELPTIVADELKPAYLAAVNRDNIALRTQLFAMAITLGESVFCTQSEALRTRADNSAVLDALTAPLLVLCGGQDALCPPDWHRAMAARARHATFVAIEDAGHMLPLEQPDRFATTIADWIDRNQECLT